MGVLLFLGKALLAYAVLGIVFWLLFRKEIQLRSRLNLYNMFMQKRNRYYYLYKKGGWTVGFMLLLYLPFYLSSLRRAYFRTISEKRIESFVKETEEILLENMESPYFGAIDKNM